jgi:DNA-binding response OmpR family regulator
VNQASRRDLVSALSVGVESQSLLLIQDVFKNLGWRLHHAQDRRRALDCLKRRPVQVVMANAHLPEWPWKSVLEDLQRMTVPPQLVVTSPLADDSLWAEVLNWGGFDVLAEPFDPSEVERVVASARRRFDPPLGRLRTEQAAAAS